MIWVSRILERASRERNLFVRLVTTSEALSHPSAAGIRDLVNERCTISLIKLERRAYSALRRLHPVLQQQLICSQALSKLVKADPNQVAHIFIPFFDAYFLWPALIKPLLLGPVTLSGIVLRTRYHLPAMGIRTELKLHSRLERFAYDGILKFQRTITLFTIDPYFAAFRKNDRLTYLRDPADYQPSNSQETRGRLGVSPKHLLVLVFGFIDERKAIKQLLQALLAERLEQVCLLIAGAQSQGTKELMSSESAKRLQNLGKLHQIPRFVEDDESDRLFAAADLIWSCYSNADGSSSVLIKAGRACRAAVVAPTGIASKLVTDHNAGWLADPSSASSIADVLRDARDNIEKRSRFAHRLNELFCEHTRENFVEPIVEHLIQVSRPHQNYAYSTSAN
jgi:glycosyltransferase involved in cell wall biosynthesis